MIWTRRYASMLPLATWRGALERVLPCRTDLAGGKILWHPRRMALPRGTRRSRSTYHHGDLRDALLDAAERALDQRGTPALALRAIARTAGVSHTAAYHHFADRQSLLRAVATRGFDQLRDALTRAAAGAPAGRRGFQEMGVAYVRFAA